MEEVFPMDTVLIVDDSMFMRMVIKNILVKAGCQVVGEAKNGADALLMYIKLRPDIVTMDITMPIMGGIQATKEICKQDPQANVIICSAMGHQLMIRDAIRAGAKDFVIKPFNEDQVREAIKKMSYEKRHPSR
jgi:two-component system, chemotaxis family, chemotaxis protein CheY